jgi:hypothetical protein
LNNLRRDIRAAFEVIEPPLGGMPERVVQTVLAERNGRLRKERMVYRLRISLALVAAVLVVAVGAAAVITWNSLHNANVTPAGVGLTQIQQLEARSLNLPTVQTASQCPESPTRSPQYQFGSGPVYADGGQEIGTDWGNYWDVIYFAAPNLKGPILVRGRDLMTSDRRVVFVGPYAAGPVIGTDGAPNTGAQHTEIVLDPAHPEARDNNHYGYWHIRQGMSNGWVGCVGFQIDGPNFSETITTFAAP